MTSRYLDPLEQLHYPDRVNYANGVLLDENDFKAEQTYFRGRLSRTLAYLHGFGTVAGLEVSTTEADAHKIQVKPGLAVDRLGRLIELPIPYCVRAEKWFEAQDENGLQESYANSTDGNGPKAVVADIFIKFNNCERGMTPCFGVGNVDATDAFTYERLRDSATLDLVLRTQPEQDKPRQKAPYDLLSDENLSYSDAIKELRKFKMEEGWQESDFWNTFDSTIKKGPEYGAEQNGTEVMLARIRLPATDNPIQYDTNGAIEIDNDIRVLSLNTFELFWLIKATRGN